MQDIMRHNGHNITTTNKQWIHIIPIHFLKARKALAEKNAIRKAEKEKEKLKYDTYKDELIKKKEAKKLKKQMEELKQYESSSEEEIIVKKKKPKKKIVYIEDDDEEEKKPVNIVINNSQPQQQVTNSRPRPRVTLGNGFY